MEIGRGRAIVRDEELISGEPAVSLSHNAEPERLERTGVEAPACVEIGHAQVNVIEQPACVRLWHQCKA